MANITTTSAASLLASLDGYVAQIVAEKEAEALATEKRGSNVETRKAALMTALVKANKKVKGSSADLAPAATAAKSLPAKSKAIAAFVESATETGLTEEQAVVLLDQMLDAKMVKELIDATYDAAKQAVFASMTLSAEESGEEFPEHTNMVLDVPELGKRFCREGAGRKPAGIDEAKLAELLGAEGWEAVTTEQTMVVRTIDEAKLAAMVVENPALLEQVRAAVVPGDWKTPRLMIRDIPANEKE